MLSVRFSVSAAVIFLLSPAITLSDMGRETRWSAIHTNEICFQQGSGVKDYPEWRVTSFLQAGTQGQYAWDHQGMLLENIPPWTGSELTASTSRQTLQVDTDQHCDSCLHAGLGKYTFTLCVVGQ